MSDIPQFKLTIPKGSDKTVRVRVTTGDYAEVGANAAAGATSITVKRLPQALSSGDKLLWGENVVITLSANAAAGATSISVDAIPGPLYMGERLEKLRDLTGGTFEMEVLTNAADATPVIAASAITATLATQSGSDRGIVDLAFADDDTDAITVGDYYGVIWRRDSGAERPIAEGTVSIVPKGFL